VHVGPSEVYPWEVREEKASGNRDVAWIADRGDAFFQLAQDTNRPFFLTVGYVDPHRDLTRAGFGNEETCDGRFAAPDFTAEDVEVPVFLSDLPETRTEFVEYYKAISRLDFGVGLILQALEKHGLTDSTLVVFTSDNGPPFLNSKTTLYDAGVHLPLIIRRPSCKPGIRNPNMVSFIDLLPTFLDWAGSTASLQLKANAPKRLGRSFLPIIDSTDVLEEEVWPQCVYGSHSFHEVQNYYPTRFLRTTRYKYHRNLAWRLDFPFASDLYASLTFEGIRNQKPPVMIGARPLKNYIFRAPEELYDLEDDPQEVHNLVHEEKHQGLLKELRHAVEKWQLRTQDPWLLRDGMSVTKLQQYVDEGLRIPERFDFDVEEPGNQNGEAWKANMVNWEAY